MLKLSENRFIRFPYKTAKILVKIAFVFAAVLGVLTFSICVIMGHRIISFDADPATAAIVRSAAVEGKIAYKLTIPEEFKALFGTPVMETTVDHSAGIHKIFLDYRGFYAVFQRAVLQTTENSVPLTLREVMLSKKSINISMFRIPLGGRRVDIGMFRPLVLRNENDLARMDPFEGLVGSIKNVSLANLDLKDHAKLLDKMRFDSRTEWPEPNKMPEGFDPARLLEEGKNPGLGIRSLHEQGIDGRGVGIAIIDQPLLKNHQEYAEQLVMYKALDLQARFASPQMHGPAVASIALGKTCGVAPKSVLYFFATSPGFEQWYKVINKIIQLNETTEVSEKIRVVSISAGRFSQQPNFSRWKEALKKAEQHGILIVTCDRSVLNYGTLTRLSDKNPDDPHSYRRGMFGDAGTVLWVPTGNRTTACWRGADLYTYEREGGMSWGAPYLAGLAALAYQVDPKIEPKTIVESLLRTAVHTDVGPVVNPKGFIKSVGEIRNQMDSTYMK
ncbi:MAG TPA: S8/S53 family peptidase [Sedimentisphaerales bacterium]|nr:S8/S53 family peptidase [Sedimentisphaerales bacterium]